MPPGPSPYVQLHCFVCKKPIGFAGQGPAYASEDGFWECGKDIDRDRRNAIEAGDPKKQKF